MESVTSSARTGLETTDMIRKTAATVMMEMDKRYIFPPNPGKREESQDKYLETDCFLAKKTRK
jgi:hypothetical protein